MAGFLTSSSVSLDNGSNVVNVTGSVDCSFVVSGTAVYINDMLMEGVSGTASDPSGNSTITLRNVYTRTSIVGGTLVAFNTIEGLRDAIQRARELSAQFQDVLGDITQTDTSLKTFLTVLDPTTTITFNDDSTVVVTPYQVLVGKVAAQGAASGITKDGGGSVQDFIDNIGSLIAGDSKLVLIPEHYPSPQAAINALQVNAWKNKTKIELRMSAGYELTEGIDCRNGDYSMFSLASVDAVVPLSPAFIGADVTGIPLGVLGEVSPTATPVKPVMLGFNAVMPQLNCLIDAGGLHGNGYQACNAYGFVGQDCGVINAGFRGIQQNGGYMSMYLAKWGGSRGSGVRQQQAASAGARSVNADNCCSVYDLDLGAIYISRSSNIELRGASAQNSGAHGILGRRCRITAADANVSGAALRGVWADTEAQIDFVGGTALNTGSNSVCATFGGEIHAGQATLSTTSAAPCINYDEGGKVYVNGGTSCGGATGEAAVLAQSVGTQMNSWDGKGILFYNGALGTVASGGSAGNFWQKFADGRMTEIQLITVNTGTIASGNFSGKLTIPTTTQTFTATYGVNMQVWGRTAVAGGGNRVFVNSCSYAFTGNEWVIKNEGVQLDGTATGLNVVSVQAYKLTTGRWK
ncbi:tail spike protein [Shewanella phage vB_SspS_KASIA]|nr:tail spike protein [Shewanella phage vB_SspS_KASIA]